MAAFADFINDEALNPQQVAFVRKVVEFVEENGSMEPSALAKAPFDRPTSFFRLFDDGRQSGSSRSYGRYTPTRPNPPRKEGGSHLRAAALPASMQAFAQNAHRIAWEKLGNVQFFAHL